MCVCSCPRKPNTIKARNLVHTLLSSIFFKIDTLRAANFEKLICRGDLNISPWLPCIFFPFSVRDLRFLWVTFLNPLFISPLSTQIQHLYRPSDNLKTNVDLKLVMCPKSKNRVVQFSNFLCLCVCLSVCLCVCPRDYSESNWARLLKFCRNTRILIC